MSGSAGSSFTAPSQWLDLPAEFIGGIDPSYADEDEANSLLLAMSEIERGRAYLAWADYSYAAVLFDRFVAAREESDGFIVDGFAECATRISTLLAISRFQAEKLLTEAVSLRDRLPEVFECLRDGIIAAWQAQVIIAGTDLVDDSSFVPYIDAAIAETLRRRPGNRSRKRLRDMVDRIIFRHDPCLVRDRRQQALADRGVWTEERGDGAADLRIGMSAENVRISYEAIKKVAESVCAYDGRPLNIRMSDVGCARLLGNVFECECGRADCTAVIPDINSVPMVDTQVIIHVVCDEATLAGTADNSGYLDGHGVITDTHVRDLANRPDAIVVPIVPSSATPNPETGTFDLPAHQPSDPYRPSSALNRHVRVRDGYCTEPGCNTSAFECDLDHIAEFDADDPDAGRTTSENLNAKCRLWHVIKTHSDWLDDQYRTADGRLVTEMTIRFTAPTQPPPRKSSSADAPPASPPRRTRTTTRSGNKHARRRAERNRNRRNRDQGPAPDY